MRLTDVRIGFFEDYEDEEVLEVAISGVDDEGVPRSFSIQRSTYEPEEQDIQAGMDSYNISTERGFTVYGCLCRVRLADSLLTLEFRDEDADALEVSVSVEVALGGCGIDYPSFSGKLRDILEWGSREKRPELIGLNYPDVSSGD